MAAGHLYVCCAATNIISSPIQALRLWAGEQLKNRREKERGKQGETGEKGLFIVPIPLHQHSKYFSFPATYPSLPTI